MNNNIGLSLGTKSIGIAVLKKQELRDYRVIRFRGIWSQDKKERIIKSILSFISLRHQYAVGIKVPESTYRSRQLNDLLQGLQKSLEQLKIGFELYTIHDLKAHCFPTQRANKKSLISCVGNKYPQLFHPYKRETRNRHAHYSKLFEATVAAELISSTNAQ